MYAACLFTLVNFITSFKNLALYQIEDLKNAFLQKKNLFFHNFVDLALDFFYAISVIANDNLS